MQAEIRQLDGEVRRRKTELQSLGEQIAKAKKKANRRADTPGPHHQSFNAMPIPTQPTREGEGGEGVSAWVDKALASVRSDLEVTINDLRAVLEATPSFVAAIDPQGCVVGWNHAAVSLTGLRRDLVLSKHLVEHFVPQPHQQVPQPHPPSPPVPLPSPPLSFNSLHSRPSLLSSHITF